MKASVVLREARLRAGLTQTELADRTGMKQPAISRIEVGMVSPTVETLEKLLLACGDSLEAVPRLGVGVDRTLIHEMLKLSPAGRLRKAASDANSLDGFLQSVRR